MFVSAPHFKQEMFMQLKLWHCFLLTTAATLSGCASNDEVRRLEQRVAYLEGRLDERESHRPPPMMMQHPFGMQREHSFGPPGPGGPGGPPGPGPHPRPDGPPRNPEPQRDHPQRNDQPGPPPPPR